MLKKKTCVSLPVSGELPNPAINPNTKKEYTPAQGGQPQSKFNKFIAKTAQTKSNPNLYKKN